MITKLNVSNYRSLGVDVCIELDRFNVLIGPNGAGKSNALDVISFFRDAILSNLPAAVTSRGGIDAVRRRSLGHPFDLKLEIEAVIDGCTSTYGFVVTGDRSGEYRVKSEYASVNSDSEIAKFRRVNSTWSGPENLAPRIDDESLVLPTLGGDKRFKRLVEFLSRLTVYAIFPDTLRQPQEFDPRKPMRSHGENWVSILREMVKDDNRKNDLVAGLEKLTGDIEDIRVTPAAGYLIVEFAQHPAKKKGKRWFSAAQQSDGTLRVAGILTALLQAPEIPVIGIEEPELTVHPGALPMLYEYLKQASETSQVIVSTHSPVLLDVADIGSDSVFVVDRNRSGTRVKRVTQDLLQPVRDQLLSLGDLLTVGDLQLSLFSD